MNTYLLHYTYSVWGQRMRGEYPPLDLGTIKGNINVTSDSLELAKNKLIDYLWNKMVDPWANTEWAVKKEDIKVHELYKSI